MQKLIAPLPGNRSRPKGLLAGGAAIFALAAAIAIATVASVGAATVAPVLVEGNPGCGDAPLSGLLRAIKIEPVVGGTHVFTANGVSHSVTILPIASGSGEFLGVDWSSTLSMDAVIMKGSPRANVYMYDPPAESFGDTGLFSPDPHRIGHVTFCYDKGAPADTPTVTPTDTVEPTATDTPVPPTATDTPWPTETPCNYPGPVCTPEPTPTPTLIPIIPLAGQSDTPGFLGDGGPAQDALVNDPHGIFDTGGPNSVYFADTGNNRIRKITDANIISTVAGGGTGCLANMTPPHDGCDALQATLAAPRDVFVFQDDIYIADTGNCRIRKVEHDTGVISTIAGTGTCGYNGDDIAATAADLNHPAGIAVAEDGTIYIADTDNCRIRKLDAVSAMISTVAGTGVCGFGGDGGDALDALLNRPYDVYFLLPGDDLIIADTMNHRIRWVDFPVGIIGTFAGVAGKPGFQGDGALATHARLNRPEAVSVADYRVFIADTGNSRIRMVNLFTNIIITIVGDGGLTDPVTLEFPAGVAVVDDGDGAGGGSAAGSGDGGSLSISNTADQTVVTAGVDPNGQGSNSFRPTVSCSVLPSISSIDWALPLVLLGMMLGRKRLGSLFTVLRSATS